MALIVKLGKVDCCSFVHQLAYFDSITRVTLQNVPNICIRHKSVKNERAVYIQLQDNIAPEHTLYSYDREKSHLQSSEYMSLSLGEPIQVLRKNLLLLQHKLSLHLTLKSKYVLDQFVIFK